jgi:mannosyl-3-phosphoglycerate phosphatase
MRTLVFTDLDGTLLDESYSWRGAKPALSELRRLEVPLVLCTSKTRAEVRELRKRLGSEDPYSVENGGLVVIPPGSALCKLIPGRVSREIIFQLGRDYAEILDTLATLAKIAGVSVRSFHHMTPGELARETGLSLRQARLARDRESSEPFKFRHGSSRQIQRFIRLAKHRGYQVQRGGRFWHLSASSDKGQALQFLSTLYQLAWQAPVRVIAMGDAPNDLAMLARADVPILLASSAGTFDLGVSAALPHVCKVSRDSPDAWSRAVLQAVLVNSDLAAPDNAGQQPRSSSARGRLRPKPLRRLVQACAQLPSQAMKRA